MPKDLPSPDLLRKLLRYDPETGNLFWRERSVDMFKAEKQSATSAQSRWNSRFANKKAFTHLSPKGYFRGKLFGEKYFAHRVIWAMVSGKAPLHQIDHIDGDTTNNRFQNLRDVPSLANNRNRCVSKSNSSGVIGVGWNKAQRKWVSRITVLGEDFSLGSFDLFEDAVRARKDAELVYGFHENHGRGNEAGNE